MAPIGPDNVADQYLATFGDAKGGRHHMPVEEVAWVIEQATRIASMRLALLKELQTALPATSEGVAAPLKELLTNLIIMQTRTADRERDLTELLSQLQTGPLSVEGSVLRDGLLALAAARDHIEGRARQGH